MDISKFFDLSGKIAIVTGGGDGIGKASCEILAAYGARVVVSDYKLAVAERVAKQIRDGGGGAIADDCGPDRGQPAKTEVAQFAKVFETNMFSMWRLCQLAAPHMREASYGNIINRSSMASINKSPAISAYASCKAAVNHMTRNPAFDYGPDIRINAIGPGAIRTHALNTILTPDIEKKMLAHTPLQRLVNGGGEQTLD